MTDNKSGVSLILTAARISAGIFHTRHPDTAGRTANKWISGKNRAFYTGYPDSVGSRPGISGYSGFHKDSPGGDCTGYSKLKAQ